MSRTAGGLDHRFRITFADEGAAVQHHQAVDDGEERMHHMLDPDDRHAGAADVADQRHQRRAFMLGQAAGDLVEQEHARLRGQSARELEPLAVEQREAAGKLVGLAGKGAALQQLDAAAVRHPSRAGRRRTPPPPRGSRTRSCR